MKTTIIKQKPLSQMTVNQIMNDIWSDDKKEDICWFTNKKGELKIDDKRAMTLLNNKGFTLLRDGDDRKSGWQIIQKDNGLLKSHDMDTIREHIYDYFDTKDSSWWDDPNRYGVSVTYNDKSDSPNECWNKQELMNKLFHLSFTKHNVGFQLQTVMKKTQYTYSTLPLLMDNRHESFIPFKNGVVHITKDEIELLKYNDVENKGCVWETQIRQRNVKIINDYQKIMDSQFAKFCDRATSKKTKSFDGVTDWVDAYETNKDVLKSLMTAYGYLIHSYNDPSKPVAPIFIDGDAEIGVADGRNGKSAVMNSISHWKKWSYQSGRSYKPPTAGGGQFQWSNVTIDTKFVCLNDLPQWFNLEDIYDRLSDDFEVRALYQNKFIIPKDKKPKIGITTNYPIKLSGGSSKHRVHTTPFGSFWLDCIEHNENPSDQKHLGKMMWEDDFSQSDWNLFYNFGFKCVQLFLNEGLHKCDISDQLIKGIVAKHEGDGTNDGVVEWWIEMIETNQFKDIDVVAGIDRKIVKDRFMKDFRTDINTLYKWSDEVAFHKMVYGVTKDMKWGYNEHKSGNGKGLNKRKHPKVIVTKDADGNESKKTIYQICVTK